MYSFTLDPDLRPGARILFASLAADGHFNPLTGLALHLKSLGYEVGWYVGRAYEAKVKEMGITYFPQVQALDVTADNLHEHFPEREKLKSGIAKLNYDLEHFFIRRMPGFYADIQDVRKVFPFDLVIAELTFTAIPLIADKMKVPVITIGIIPNAESSRDLGPMGLGLTPPSSLLGKWKYSGLRWLANNVLMRKPMRVLDELLAAEGVKRDGNLFDTAYRKSTLILQSGTPGFEYQRSDLNPKLRYIGPLLPAPSEKKRQPWTHPKLSEYNKVILVTQGTAEADVEKLIVPTLEAFKDTDHLVVVTTAGNQTEALRQRYPYDNIIIEDFIPFADIMPHCHVYVTNGGYGGTLLGIQHRLPLVVAGVNEGKNEICARVGYFKLGVNLKTETPQPAQVRAAVLQVLADRTYRKNVVRLAQEFAQYNPQQLCAQYVAQVLLQNRKQPQRSEIYV